MKLEEMKIVSIDDNENNLFLIEAICEEQGFNNITSFSDPLDALPYVLNNQTDLIIIDYMMPELNGIEFIQEFRRNNQLTPIIMVTAANEETIHGDALDAGANDFLSKPINVALFNARVINQLKLYRNSFLLADKAKLLEDEVSKATEDLLQREHETLNILAKTAEFKDPETGSHVARVAYYSKMLAREYGLNSSEQELVFHASPFHDLGKVGIPDNILLKPGRLDEDEFNFMKTHSTIGYEILKNSKSKYLQVGAEIALTHHEKWDGTGYPSGLKGENISIFGRIVAVADVFDALTSHRPYKKAWSFDDAISFLEEQKANHFDPTLVEHFINNIDEVREIFNTHQEDNVKEFEIDTEKFY